jgi:hypothetical protein
MAFIVYADPENPEQLQALGLVAIRHGHLHHQLRMLLKTLAEVSVEDAMDATAREPFGALCDRVRRLAKQRLGEGSELVRLQALVERAKRETQKRNNVIHSVCGRDVDGGQAVLLGEGGELRPFPTVDELNDWAATFGALAHEINNERLGGFIQTAIAARPER